MLTGALPRLEQHHRHLPHVKVHVVARLVDRVGAKVAADEAVPHAVVLRGRVARARVQRSRTTKKKIGAGQPPTSGGRRAENGCERGAARLFDELVADVLSDLLLGVEGVERGRGLREGDCGAWQGEPSMESRLRSALAHGRPVVGSRAAGDGARSSMTCGMSQIFTTALAFMALALALLAAARRHSVTPPR